MINRLLDADFPKDKWWGSLLVRINELIAWVNRLEPKLNTDDWDTAYDDRLKWDGGSTGLTAATGRTSLGLGNLATKSTIVNADVDAAAAIDGSKIAAATAPAYGVVKGGAVPGLTTGGATTGGYIGERVPVSFPGGTGTALTSSYANIASGSLSLDAGVWLIVAATNNYCSAAGGSQYARYRIQNTTDSTTLVDTGVAIRDQGSGVADFWIPVTIVTTVSISSTKVFQLQATDPTGSGLLRAGYDMSGIDSQNEFFAVRVG